MASRGEKKFSDMNNELISNNRFTIFHFYLHLAVAATAVEVKRAKRNLNAAACPRNVNIFHVIFGWAALICFGDKRDMQNYFFGATCRK